MMCLGNTFVLVFSSYTMAFVVCLAFSSSRRLQNEMAFDPSDGTADPDIREFTVS